MDFWSEDGDPHVWLPGLSIPKGVRIININAPPIELAPKITLDVVANVTKANVADVAIIGLFTLAEMERNWPTLSALLKQSTVPPVEFDYMRQHDVVWVVYMGAMAFYDLRCVQENKILLAHFILRMQRGTSTMCPKHADVSMHRTCNNCGSVVCDTCVRDENDALAIKCPHCGAENAIIVPGLVQE